MARDALHAWIGEDYIGRFERDFDVQNPRFVYVSDAQHDVSLSLRRGEAHRNRAPKHFLEGLLPERFAARERIRMLVGASSTESWELLAGIGGDLPGGLLLSPTEDRPDRGESLTQPAQDDIIAARILDIKNGGTGYGSTDTPPRFSLAGAQGKFAITEFEGDYYWPDAATPSTHIFKPEGQEYPGLELVEAAALELARRAGLAAPTATRLEFTGETTYAVERFDREAGSDGLMRRLHMEDLTQALGRPVDDKYQVHTDDIITVLRDATGDEEAGYEFFRQYVFNTLIGNSDAHGKNYSVLLSHSTVSLSPLYDSIPVGMFDGYRQTLSMPVGQNEQFLTLSEADWEEAFDITGLDRDRLRAILRTTSEVIQEHLDDTIGAVDHPVVTAERLDVIRRVIDRFC